MASKHGWRVRGAVVALAVVSAAIASVTLPDRPVDLCPDGDEVATVDGVTLCSHGTDGGALAGPTEPAGGTESAPRAIACIGNGSSGARVQAVFARLAGRADRYAALAPSVQAAAADVEHLVNRSAAQTGGERHVRWASATRATATGCTLAIARVTVPAGAATDFGALVESLDAQGLDRHDRKYLVWVDSPTTLCTGIATHLSDDRPGPENYNNTSVGYARVDESCLGRGGLVETHELLHLLGAVQRSAPNVSPEGHCSDEFDLLCYDEDGAGPFRTTVRCPTRANDRRLDCHHDDYFSTDPAPGSYLATHWNAADSRYLEDEAPVIVPGPHVDPPPNDAFAAAPVLSGYAGTTPGTLAGATLEEGEPNHGGTVAGSTWYKWRPRVDGPVSVDTRGSSGDTVLDVYTGADLATLARLGSSDDAADLAPQSRVTFTAVAGTTYRIAVSGRGQPIDTVLRWGPPPHGFTDVLPGARCETAVGWAAAFAVMPGRADHTWRPHDTVNRGQAVATLWRMLGAPDPAGDPDPAPTSTTTTAVPPSTTVPASTPTTSGTPGTTTPPTATETAGASTPAAGGGPSETGDPSLPFTDVGQDAPYRTALAWAVESGVVVPSGTTFRPRDPLTRADLALWAWAALGRPTAPPASFADVRASAPYATAASWATARRLVASYPDDSFRPATAVTRAKLAMGLFALAGDPAAWAAVPAGDVPGTVVF